VKILKRDVLRDAQENAHGYDLYSHGEARGLRRVPSLGEGYKKEEDSSIAKQLQRRPKENNPREGFKGAPYHEQEGD
jgi:hypothetical protein